MSKDALFQNPDFRADLRDLEISSREIQDKWGFAYSATNKWRRRLANGEVLPGELGFMPKSVGNISLDATKAAADSESHDSSGMIIDAAKMSESPWGLNEWREYLRLKGQDPDKVTFNYGVTSNPQGGYWNKLNNVRLIDEIGTEPAWPVITPGPTFVVPPVKRTPRISTWKTAILLADTQIGYREVDGVLDPFHDDAAIDVALQIVESENPEGQTGRLPFIPLE